MLINLAHHMQQVQHPEQLTLKNPNEVQRTKHAENRKILMHHLAVKRDSVSAVKRNSVSALTLNLQLETFFSTIPIQCRDSDNDMLVFLDRIRGELREILMEELARRKSFKFYLTISPLLHRINVDGEVQSATPYLHSRPAIVMHTTDLDAEIETAATRLAQLLECFEDQGSGYTLSESWPVSRERIHLWRQ